jgi:hypothetical protein
MRLIGLFSQDILLGLQYFAPIFTVLVYYVMHFKYKYP